MLLAGGYLLVYHAPSQPTIGARQQMRACIVFTDVAGVEPAIAAQRPLEANKATLARPKSSLLYLR
jgi:hypothetical protein